MGRTRDEVTRHWTRSPRGGSASELSEDDSEESISGCFEVEALSDFSGSFELESLSGLDFKSSPTTMIAPFGQIGSTSSSFKISLHNKL